MSVFIMSINYNFVFAEEQEILIASWNMLLYSENRAFDEENRQKVIEILLGRNYDYEDEPNRDYDIIFVQEILSNGTSMDVLCKDLRVYDYECKTTPEIRGEGTRPETYGVIHKNTLNVIIEDTSNENTVPLIFQGQDYTKNEMVRPPMKATITLENGFQITVFNNHIKPSNSTHKNMTENELRVLQRAINYEPSNDEENIMVLGDLNAGGTYLKKGIDSYHDLFKPDLGWHSIFSNSDHTTFAQSTRSYDKIIVSDDLYSYYTGEYGIIGYLPDGDSFGYPTPGYRAGDYRMSDHKLIYAAFQVPDTELEFTELDSSNYAYGSLTAVLGAIFYEMYISRRQ